MLIDFERGYNDFHRFFCKTCRKPIVFFDFPNHTKAQIPIFTAKKSIWGTAPDLPDPPDPINLGKMEHELRQATHQQRAGGKDDVSPNKLPQIIIYYDV